MPVSAAVAAGGWGKVTNPSVSVVTARRGLALTAYHPHGAMPIGSYPFRGEYSVLKVRVPSGTLRGFPRGLGC